MTDDMLIELNIQLVRDWVERVWNEADLEALSQFHPPSFQNEGRPTALDEIKQWHQGMRATYPDLHYVIEDMVATNDRVAFRWTATGTQRGTLWGIIPPSHKTVTWSGMHLLRIVNNRIVEVWAIADTISVLQQLGVKLEPGL